MDQLSVLQAWLLIGIPSLVIAAALYVARAPLTGILAFFVLFAGFGGMAMVHRPSAGALGGLLALLYAAGRGGVNERGARPNYRA